MRLFYLAHGYTASYSRRVSVGARKCCVAAGTKPSDIAIHVEKARPYTSRKGAILFKRPRCEQQSLTQG